MFEYPLCTHSGFIGVKKKAQPACKVCEKVKVKPAKSAYSFFTADFKKTFKKVQLGACTDSLLTSLHQAGEKEGAKGPAENGSSGPAAPSEVNEHCLAVDP